MTIRGIAFPFRKENGEFPKMAENEELVSSNLIALFNTPVRRRVMRPELGTTVQSLVFEGITPVLTARLERSIRRSVVEGEPRARVVNIEVTTQDTLVNALVTYDVNGVRKQTSLNVNGG